MSGARLDGLGMDFLDFPARMGTSGVDHLAILDQGRSGMELPKPVAAWARRAVDSRARAASLATAL